MGIETLEVIALKGLPRGLKYLLRIAEIAAIPGGV
jgi:hypothetical protein